MRPTALILAALAAPAVGPAEYAIPFPAIERYPAAIQAEIAAWRARPAGAFALRVYADDRRSGS